MDNSLLYQKISTLPDKEKLEVEAFVNAIEKKTKKGTISNKAKAGSGKGLFLMATDFDEPLSYFKEYMQ